MSNDKNQAKKPAKKAPAKKQAAKKAAPAKKAAAKKAPAKKAPAKKIAAGNKTSTNNPGSGTTFVYTAPVAKQHVEATAELNIEATPAKQAWFRRILNKLK